MCHRSTSVSAIETVFTTSSVERQTTQRVLAAIIAPAALFGTSTALIVDAKMRAVDANERVITATAIAQSAVQASLDPIPNQVPYATLDEAAMTSEGLGYTAHLHNSHAPYKVHINRNGQIDVTVPVDAGHASVRFRRQTFATEAASSVIIAVAACLIAAVIGIMPGRSLSANIKHATTQVRALGTDSIRHDSLQSRHSVQPSNNWPIAFACSLRHKSRQSQDGRNSTYAEPAVRLAQPRLEEQRECHPRLRGHY